MEHKFLRHLFKPLSFAACLLTMVSLAFTLPSRADAGLKDDGHFFKPETVERVTGEIKKIHDDFGKQLVIETYAAIPEARKADWDAAKDDPKTKSAFFGKWLGERTHDLEVNGVYILIVKDPGHLEVKAGKKTKEKTFTEANQNKLSDILITAFKAKNYDEGLQTGVDYFRDSLKENLGGVKHTGPSAANDEQFHHPSSGSSSGSHLPSGGGPTRTNTSSFNWTWIILVVIGAFVIIRILSSLAGRGNSGGPGYSQSPGYGGGYGSGYGAGGGGGGFFRNMLGGMLGGAAGGYLYDRFRDRNDPNYQPPQNQGGTSSDNSSGGDFNSSSSSSDNDAGQGFGGGGSGGDFGSSGGDSGGGGGDSGGGSGGDF